MKSLKTKIWDMFVEGPQPITVHVDDDGNGIIDAAAKRAFRNGQCHALALEIHKATKWPIVGLFSRSDDGSGSPSHVVTYDQNIDEFIDIGGKCDPSKLPWTVTHMAEMDPKKIPTLEDYIKPNLKVAKPFVRTVVGPIEKLPRKLGQLTNKFKYMPLSIQKIAENEGLTSLLA